MNITLTIPDSAVLAEQFRVDQFNKGSGQPPLTIEQFAQLERDEVTAQRVATLNSTMESMMRPTAAKIIEAAGGDPTKLQTALPAGENAALAAIAAIA